MNKIETFFRLEEKNTTIRKELRGGVTTFLSTLYMIMVIPAILSVTGVNSAAAMKAVCLITGIGSILAGILSNTAFIVAPGLGLGTIFTYTICKNYGATWNQALTLVALSGVIYLILTLTPLRERITDSIPMPFKFALSAGVGLLITLSALINSGLVTAENNLLDMGSLTDPSPLLALLGIFLTAVLYIKKIPCAIIIGMAVTSLLGIPFGVTSLPKEIITGAGLSEVAFKFDFSVFTSLGFIPVFSSILSLVVASFFDSIGTILGVATDLGLTSATGDLDGDDRLMKANGISTILGSLIGVSSLTVMAESATGMKEGARSGLSSITAGILFLLLTPFAPLGKIIPGAAMAAPLVMVGMSMMSGITQITWKHVEVSLPCFLIIMGTPFTFSITTGLMLGVISYTVIMAVHKHIKVVDPVLYGLSFIFILNLVLGALL